MFLLRYSEYTPCSAFSPAFIPPGIAFGPLIHFVLWDYCMRQL